MSKTHKIRQGECLSSIAKSYGFDDWRIIYNDPENADFKAEHPNPNLIYPGEKLIIPDLSPGGVSCATNQRHRFELARTKTLLRIKVLGADHKPLANKPYTLTLTGVALPKKADTDGEGLLETEIDPDITKGVLEVHINGRDQAGGVAWDLLIGALDPVDKTTGQQARLNNLGFESGKIDGIAGKNTTAATKRFQKYEGLKESGVCDQHTQNKLQKSHGC